MHDNFEREVQKKMEELNLTPSVPVWEKIELQIRPEKRRRRVLIWFFLGILLLSGGVFSYQILSSNKEIDNSISEQASKNQPSNFSVPPTSETIIKKEEQNTSLSTTNEDAPPTQPLVKKEETTEDKIDKTVLSSKPKETATIGKEAKKRFGKQTVSITKLNAGKKIATNETVTTPKTSTDITAVPEASTNTAPNPVSQPTPTETIDIDKKMQTVDSVKTPSPEKNGASPIDTSLRKKVAAKSNWKRRIFLAAGVSDQVSSLNTAKVTMDAVIPQAGGVGASLPPINPTPADVTPALGFMVGYELSKKLSEHFELSVGLRYAYYSAKLRIGANRRADTTIRYGAGSFVTNQFYTNTARRSDYTIRYHTLQVPVSIHYKPVINFPLYITTGASYGQVISTNALTFSRTSNLYYRNKENDVQSLLPVHASVQVGLFEKTKTSMRVGPMLQYNILKSQKENPSNASHLFFAGLQSTINF